MKCFTIMPFSETIIKKNEEKIIISSEEWNFIFEKWIKKAVESFKETKIECIRSETKQGNFVKGIVKDIYNSELAIVDLTGSKPNVYYELGIRHSLKLGTIIITQDFNALPSDLKSYYCFEYTYKSESHLYNEHYSNFEKALHNQIEHVFRDELSSDNPVSDFLDLKHYYEKNKLETEKNEIQNIRSEVITQINNIYNRYDRIIEKHEFTFLKEFNYSMFSSITDTNLMDLFIISMFKSDYSIQNAKKVKEIKDIYCDFRIRLYQLIELHKASIQHPKIENRKIVMKTIHEMKGEIPRYIELLNKINFTHQSV